MRDLAAARAIAAPDRRLRCVTLQGELLEPDGTLTVGTHHAETGILSRKSELRELREQATRARPAPRRAGARPGRPARADRRRWTAASSRQQLEIDVLAEQAADLRSRIGQHGSGARACTRRSTSAASEMSDLEQEIEQLQTSWQQAREQAGAAEARCRRLQARLEEAEREIREARRAAAAAAAGVHGGKVALAQVEERLTALRPGTNRSRPTCGSATRSASRREQQLAATRGTAGGEPADAAAGVVGAGDVVLRKEAGGTGWPSWTQRARRSCARSGSSCAEQAQASAQHLARAAGAGPRPRTGGQRPAPPPRHPVRPAARGLPARPGRAVQAAGPKPTTRGRCRCPSTLDTDAGRRRKQEIAELRRKLSRLGSVNLEALQELAELEARSSTCRSSTTT